MTQTAAPAHDPAPRQGRTRETPSRRDQPFFSVLQEACAGMGCDAVELNVDRQHGKAVIAGTRLPVSVVLTYLASGQSLQQIADEFGGVTTEQLRDAIQFAAEVLGQDVGA